MKKKYKIGVIGAGFMASAIVKGAIDSGVIPSSQIIVSDVSQIALDKIARLGVSTTLDNTQLVEQSDFVLFAVKPQSLTDVFASIKTKECSKIITIMAGVKKQRFKDNFTNVLVARCMPNTPCAISNGAVGIDLSDFTEEEDISFIQDMFSSLAEVVLLDESKMNAVTGISGSAPAYFYLFLKGVIEAGVEQGLTYEQAKALATNTMIGAGYMVVANHDKTLDELINAVCSKGGTTIEAVKVYNDGELTNLTKKAVDACVKRSAELENV